MSKPTYAWELDEAIRKLEADLSEERQQRRELGEALVRVTEERDAAITRNHMLVAEYTKELERLRTIIGELGAAEAAEPPEPCDCFCHDCCVPLTDACEHCGDRHPEEQIEALRPGGDDAD